MIRHTEKRLAVTGIIVGGVAVTAYAGAYLVRFDMAPSLANWGVFALTAPLVAGLRIAFALCTGLHKVLLTNVTRAEVWRAIATATGGSVTLVAVVAIARRLEWSPFSAIPYGVIALDWGLAIGGLEALWLVQPSGRRGPLKNSRRVVIVGAGESGHALAQQMQRSPQYRLTPVAFVDDNLSMRGRMAGGIRIAGVCSELSEVVRDYGADLVIIAIPSATQEQTRRVIDECRKAKIPHRLLPSIAELVDGSVTLSRVREIDVADLLARPMAEIDHDAIRALISGQRIAVTGGGGSVGSELARQIARLGPAALLLVDHAENPLFFLDAALRLEFPDLELQVRVADVTDPPTIERLFAMFRPHAVFHAAAHKHVPLMEDVPIEAIRNNVGGTLATAEAAIAAQAKCFVLVSTDKAVHPSSVMGATKRLCELVTYDLSQQRSTNFISVRFGNVLGSNGSVVPIFQAQLRTGGPITVTDERMERYFMALPEAAGLILEAGAVGESGQTFILDMGKPIRIVELAETLIRMEGLEPYRDVDIVFTGTRPGEKLTEELHYHDEAFAATAYDKLLSSREAERRGSILPAVRAFLSELPTLSQLEARTRLWALIEDRNDRSVDADGSDFEVQPAS